MNLDCRIAEQELEKAEKLNPGLWVSHSRYVALACKNIAHRCRRRGFTRPQKETKIDRILLTCGKSCVILVSGSEVLH